MSISGRTPAELAKNQMQTARQCAILIYKYCHWLNKGETTMEQLLKILEDNARMSVEDIAAMLNKSPPR